VGRVDRVHRCPAHAPAAGPTSHHRVVSGRGAQLAGVDHGVPEGRSTALGDQVGEVCLEPCGELLLLFGVEVGEVLPDVSDEVADLGRDGALGQVLGHAAVSWALMSEVMVVLKARQSSLWRLSSARPAVVMP
jgi:hypothetical protein